MGNIFRKKKYCCHQLMKSLWRVNDTESVSSDHRQASAIFLMRRHNYFAIIRLAFSHPFILSTEERYKKWFSTIISPIKRKIEFHDNSCCCHGDQFSQFNGRKLIPLPILESSVHLLFHLYSEYWSNSSRGRVSHFCPFNSFSVWKSHTK